MSRKKHESTEMTEVADTSTPAPELDGKKRTKGPRTIQYFVIGITDPEKPGEVVAVLPTIGKVSKWFEAVGPMINRSYQSTMIVKGKVVTLVYPDYKP